MLRHAKVQTTLDLYTQGDNDNKISAQDRFCGLIVDQDAATIHKPFKRMAGTTGLEPATSAVTGQRSNQLNYAASDTVVRSGDVVQLVRTLPCHGRGRGFESRRPRQFFQALARNWQFASWSNLVQLGQCLSLVEHHPNKFALCQPLVRHTRLSVKIQRNATVRMT